ncbi:hypothetical protein [Cellvibrio sp. PSBB023]|uniref:hypothetical protein n=1 Tax=Cellvibrio sp. PSBB023 TaxID=1945512 RepID=UPI00098F9722|nr:hypothetical protein [Cellvibrio sp. PSBB023]AQT60662.1 hypothetical protein B0D95_11670 [Cellvibrio sp. PSBB023]
MEIPNVWAPLLVSAVRDAVLFQEQLLKSETIRNRADYEEHHLQLTQFLEFIKEEYKSIEGEVGLPLERLL